MKKAVGTGFDEVAQTIIDMVTDEFVKSEGNGKLHIRFVCRTCGRVISGCLRSCDEETHLQEAVDSCAICARKEKEDIE